MTFATQKQQHHQKATANRVFFFSFVFGGPPTLRPPGLSLHPAQRGVDAASGRRSSSPAPRRSCLPADLAESLELGPERAQEVEVVVVADVAAASHGAGRGAHPLEAVGVGDVVGEAPVLLGAEVAQLLQDAAGTGSALLLAVDRAMGERLRRGRTRGRSRYDWRSDITPRKKNISPQREV